MQQETIIAILSGLVVIAFFKERISASWEKFRLSLKYRKSNSDHNAQLILDRLERVSSELMLHRSDAQVVIAKLDEIETMLKIATGESAAQQSAIYMQGFETLSRSSAASLEKQEKIEQLLIQVVTNLKKIVD